MANDILFWIQISCSVGGVICAGLAYYLMTQFYKAMEYLQKATKAEGPEREALIMKAIELTEKQLSKIKEGKDKAARAHHLYTLGIAYEMLASIKNESANMQLGVKAFRESIELTDREKQRADYVKRRSGLGDTYRDLAKKGEEEKYAGLALVEFQEALGAADTKETTDKRPGLESDISGCHLALARRRKDGYHASEAIRLIKAQLAAIDPQKDSIKYHLTSMVLANAFAIASDIENPVENLHQAVEQCNRALAAREQMDRQFADMAKGTIGATDNVKLLKTMDNVQTMRAISEYKLLSLFSTLHLRLADLEDRQKHLDSAMWAADEASKLRRLQQEPDFLKSIQKWKGLVERMKAGESFEQVSGKDARAEPGFADGDEGLPA